MNLSMNSGRLAPLVLLAAMAVAALPACNKARAATPGPMPMLHVPDAPARVNIPVNPDPPPPVEPPPVVTTDKPVTTPPPASTTKPRPTATPTPVATPPPAADPPGPPVRVPQTDYEERAKARLASARQNIAKVKRESLGQGARAQHESATRFIKMAADALAVKNFLFAFYCADKAATLAELLVKRS